ncbi:uncharacterized protein ARMOST_10042 [Armillaria ostoyae]|uniref:Uncharacterized protein n=1 Tax=Armillaria ostoyae TaxID=47428 RepID=A0A284RDA2_ARMOS|nr:uncharacterized protein ARMOST_10042 [Armillaria ostoyae]
MHKWRDLVVEARQWAKSLLISTVLKAVGMMQDEDDAQESVVVSTVDGPVDVRCYFVPDTLLSEGHPIRRDGTDQGDAM